MTQKEELLDLAQELAIGVENNDEDRIWQCVLSMAGWVQQTGHLSLWGFECNKNGVKQIVDSCWLRPDEDVRQYIARSKDGWDLEGVDEILVFRDYAERLSDGETGKATFVVPLREKAHWQVDGF